MIIENKFLKTRALEKINIGKYYREKSRLEVIKPMKKGKLAEPNAFWYSHITKYRS